MATVAQLIRQSPVGKVVGGTLYIHASAVRTLPEELDDHVEAALEVAKDKVFADRITLVKIDRSGAVVSFLEYPDFDVDPHPPLHRAVTVNLGNGKVRVANYRANRPILHRKETFVDEDYPGREVFAELTEAEAAEGLLGRSDIGREDQWEDVLAAAGLAIEDHTLVSLD